MDVRGASLCFIEEEVGSKDHWYLSGNQADMPSMNPRRIALAAAMPSTQKRLGVEGSARLHVCKTFRLLDGIFRLSFLDAAA